MAGPQPAQLELFPTRAYLTRVAPEHNQRRFYLLLATPTLFGDWALVREWGRIGSPGRVRLEAHRGPGAALDALARLQRQKRRRGYREA